MSTFRISNSQLDIEYGNLLDRIKNDIQIVCPCPPTEEIPGIVIGSDEYKQDQEQRAETIKDEVQVETDFTHTLFLVGSNQATIPPGNGIFQIENYTNRTVSLSETSTSPLYKKIVPKHNNGTVITVNAGGKHYQMRSDEAIQFTWDQTNGWVNVSTDGLKLNDFSTVTPQILTETSQPTSAQGTSVSTAKDGDLIAVGAPGATGFIGSPDFVNIYMLSGGSYQLQQTVNAPTPNVRFGQSVSLSGDGKFLAVGAPNYNSNNGGVYLFEMNEQGQYINTDILVGIGNTGPAKQGMVVSMSVDGKIVAWGGPEHANGKGAAWVQQLNDDVLTFCVQHNTYEPHMCEQIMLTSTSSALAAKFGYSVSIDPSGSFLVVGAPFDSLGGTVSIYHRFGLNWRLMDTKSHSDGVNFGYSVHTDGDYIAVGSPNSEGNQGLVFVFAKLAESWFRSAILAVKEPNPKIGHSVYINDKMMVTGGINYQGDDGGVWTFVQENGLWTESSDPLNPLSPPIHGADKYFGISVALSSSTNTLVVGSNKHNDTQGAISVYKV